MPRDTSDRLWAPWRNAYLTKTDARARKPGCFLCRAVKGRQDRASLVVARSPLAFAILNGYPYNQGHLLISPTRHIGSFTRLQDREVDALMRMLQTMTRALETLLRPQGLNIGLNQGRAAGAGVPGHLHLHVVPRWISDTNFMPLIGNTKVISESLDAMQTQLSRAVREQAADRPRRSRR